MRPIGIALVLMIVTLVGCRPAEDSGTKSLDALAGVEKSKIACSGSFVTPFDFPGALGARANRQITFPKAVEADVKKAFTSVPPGLSRAVLLLGYDILYTNDPAKACKGVRAGAFKQALGCARITKVPTSGGDAERVQLVMSAKLEDIAHSTLLGIASLVANKLGKISAAPGEFVLRDEEDQLMTNFKRDFAAAVIHDAALQGLELVQLKGLLPQNTALTDRITTLAARRGLWDRYRAEQPALSEAAELSIFANGADSYYCSAETKKSLGRWPTARDLWTKTMAPDIEQLENLGSEAAVVPASAEPQSLGLWGRWGGGNGPLRQMFSNRVDDTGYAFPRVHGLRRGWDGSGEWYDPPAWGDGRLGWRLRGDGASAGGSEEYYEE